MTSAWRAPIAAVRWSLALAIAMYIFHWLMVFAFSPFGVVVATFPLLGVTDEALLFALGSLIFALISAISIGIGAVIVPHRYWRLAVGLLSIAVVLPMATLFIQDTFISGDRAFDVTDLGALASVAAGGAVLYGVLHWLRARRIHRPALSNRSSLATW